MKKYIPVTIAAALLFASCLRNETEDLPGILINGIRWAPANVVEPGVFATSSSDGGMYYQWGRRTGWWYPVGSQTPVSSPAGETWNPEPASGEQWPAAADPCPEGWRLPTQKDLAKLFDSEKVSYRGTSDKEDDAGGGIEIPGWNSSRTAGRDMLSTRVDYPFDRPGLDRRDSLIAGKGIVFTDRSSGRKLFLPAAGMINHAGGRLADRGSDGFYRFLWEGEVPNSDDLGEEFDSETYAFHFWFHVTTDQLSPVTTALPSRAEGFSVRCVLKQ